MKKSILAIAILFNLVSYGQTDQARVSKVNNKLVFFYNEPINDYETAFTFKNGIQNINCLNPEQISIESIKNANLEAANQGRIYDAIIYTNGADRDMAITWKDKSKDNAIARVKKIEGKLLFVQCEPLVNYDIASKYNVSGGVQKLLLGTCPTLQDKIDKLIKKANKDKAFDGVMYGSSTNDLAIKFK
jgi:hypothetical protein